MTSDLLKVQEVATMIDTSIQTISSWYRWRDLHPDNPYAQMLPEYTRIGNKNTRYWKRDDIWALVKFKASIPQGRGGIMGDVTQKYCKKDKFIKEVISE